MPHVRRPRPLRAAIGKQCEGQKSEEAEQEETTERDDSGMIGKTSTGWGPYYLYGEYEAIEEECVRREQRKLKRAASGRRVRTEIKKLATVRATLRQEKIDSQQKAA